MDVQVDENNSVVVAHTEYAARLPIELALQKGQRVVVIDAKTRVGWTFGVLGRSGKSGWFPSNHALTLEQYKLRIRTSAEIRAFSAALKSDQQWRALRRGDASPAASFSCRACQSSSGASLPCLLCGMVPAGEQLQVESLTSHHGINRFSLTPSSEHPRSWKREFVKSFRCPRSGKLMTNPMLLKDGTTVDSSSLSRHVDGGAIPNHTFRGAIAECIENGPLNIPCWAELSLSDEAVHASRQITSLEISNATLMEEFRSLSMEIESLTWANDVLKLSRRERKQQQQQQQTHQRPQSSAQASSESLFQPGRTVAGAQPGATAADEEEDASSDWVLSVVKKLRAHAETLPRKGGPLSEHIEDELDNLSSEFAAIRKISLLRWERNRGRLTAAQEHEKNARQALFPGSAAFLRILGITRQNDLAYQNRRSRNNTITTPQLSRSRSANNQEDRSGFIAVSSSPSPFPSFPLGPRSPPPTLAAATTESSSMSRHPSDANTFGLSSPIQVLAAPPPSSASSSSSFRGTLSSLSPIRPMPSRFISRSSSLDQSYERKVSER